MVRIEDAIIVRLKRGNEKFEVLADPWKVQELRKGKQIGIDEIVAYPEVYRDAKKSNLAAESDLQRFFGTVDVLEVAKKVVFEGDLEFTTEQRRKFLEEKTNQIVDIIFKRAINPQTNTPHPPQRILNAIHQAGIHIDPFVDANLQVDKVVKSIKPILPIKFESVVIQLTMPPQHVGKAYQIFKHSFQSFEEQWLNDGSLQIVLTIPAGIEAELLQKVANETKGDFKSKIIKRVEG